MGNVFRSLRFEVQFSSNVTTTFVRPARWNVLWLTLILRFNMRPISVVSVVVGLQVSFFAIRFVCRSKARFQFLGNVFSFDSYSEADAIGEHTGLFYGGDSGHVTVFRVFIGCHLSANMVDFYKGVMPLFRFRLSVA